MFVAPGVCGDRARVARYHRAGGHAVGAQPVLPSIARNLVCALASAGTGQDYTLDPELIEACQQIIEPQIDAFRSAGAFAPQVAVPAEASAQTRFLAMLGRTG